MSDLQVPFRTVFLTGFMAAGKTRVGRALSERIGWPFVDLDEEVERLTGRTVPQLFEEGEERFRKEEAAALRRLCYREDADPGAELPDGSPHGRQAGRIVALGGGTLTDAASRRLVAEKGLLVYLRVDPETLERRLKAPEPDRPMLAGVDAGEIHQRIMDLLEERRPHYEAASVIVDCDDDRPLAGIVEELIYEIHI